MLQKVLKGERPSLPEDRLSGDVLTKTHVTQHPSHGDVLTTWEFDYQNVTREELISLASRHLVIAYRPRFKAMKAEEASSFDGKISVRDWLDGKRRTKVSAVEKGAKVLAKATKAEREALLAMLRESLEADEQEDSDES